MPAFVNITKTLATLSKTAAAYKEAEALAQKGLNKEEIKAGLLEAGITPSLAANAAGHAADAVAKTGDAAATSLLDIALKSLLGTLSSILPWLAVAAVAGGILAAAFNKIKESSPAYQLDQANKALDEAKQRADEAKQAYDGLNSSLESYNNLQKDLSEMDDAESKEAISEMNKDILDLILNTKDWQKAFQDGIKYDDSGLIIISEAQEE